MVPLLFFFLAVMVAGGWGGWGPAIASIAFAVLFLGAEVLPPVGSAGLEEGNVLATALFTLVAGLSSWLNVRQQRSNAERVALLAREQAARRGPRGAPACLWERGL